MSEKNDIDRKIEVQTLWKTNRLSDPIVAVINGNYSDQQQATMTSGNFTIGYNKNEQ